MKSTYMLSMAAALATAGICQFAASFTHADSPTAAALAGTVTSDAEGKMEGVVVTAHKDGSIVSVSVTTRRAGPLQLSGEPARARPLHARHPRRRL